jgi:hypothetical protein
MAPSARIAATAIQSVSKPPELLGAAPPPGWVELGLGLGFGDTCGEAAGMTWTATVSFEYACVQSETETVTFQVPAVEGTQVSSVALRELQFEGRLE